MQPLLLENAVRFPSHASEIGITAPRLIDLFSGCGGLTQGFVDAGFLPVLAVEILPDAARSYRENFQCPVHAMTIESFCAALEKGHLLLPSVDVIVGGPPCQGFSPLGKMSVRSPRRRRQNKMNDLSSYFLRVVRHLLPEVVIIENVPEFLKSPQFEKVRYALDEMEYKVTAGILRADHYGVPQKRRRAFLIAARRIRPLLPLPTGEFRTVRDAIGHLPLEPTNSDWHIGRNPRHESIERYKAVPPGGNRFDLVRNRRDLAPPCWIKKKTGTTDVFGRLRWNEPSGTIRTEFFKPEKGRYLHPEAHRPITHREAACLQTFPPGYTFVGSKISVARQIGEAVPPKLAYEIARAALLALQKARKAEDVGKGSIEGPLREERRQEAHRETAR